MQQNTSKCFRFSDGKICPFCNGEKIIKNGRTKNLKQQYVCKICHKRFIDTYTYQAYQSKLNRQIITLTKEGMGIRSTSRVLDISNTTLIKRILYIADNIQQPIIKMGRTYELDEMRTFIQNKNKIIWLIYALDKESREIVSYKIGSRTNINLKVVVDSLMYSKAAKIYTDKLGCYKTLITETLHSVKNRGINYIERNNLTIRTHLKRFNRRTICFTRSLLLLSAIVKIYFWG